MTEPTAATPGILQKIDAIVVKAETYGNFVAEFATVAKQEAHNLPGTAGKDTEEVASLILEADAALKALAAALGA